MAIKKSLLWNAEKVLFGSGVHLWFIIENQFQFDSN